MHHEGTKDTKFVYRPAQAGIHACQERSAGWVDPGFRRDDGFFFVIFVSSW
jgi:hypothetical protein